jgi:hypothetical protein
MEFGPDAAWRQLSVITTDWNLLQILLQWATALLTCSFRDPFLCYTRIPHRPLAYEYPVETIAAKRFRSLPFLFLQSPAFTPP